MIIEMMRLFGEQKPKSAIEPRGNDKKELGIPDAD